jgi:hypothetical protein
MRTTYTKEAHVKDDVKALLDKYGWFWFMPPANAYGKSGISDFIAVKTGTFMAIETKFGTNKPTPMQIGFLNSIRAADGFAFVINEKNITWLDVFLRSFDGATQAQIRSEPIAHDDGANMLDGIQQMSNKFLDTVAD